MRPPEMVLHLPQKASSALKARTFTREVLVGWDLEDLVYDAQLGTSELVSNVINHVGTGLVLTIELDEFVKISVRDGHPQMGPVHPPDNIELSEHGRGLRIVDAVSANWGVEITAESKTVWFTLPVRSRVSL